MFVNAIIDNDIVQAQSNADALDYTGGYAYRKNRILMTTDSVASTDGVIGGIKVSQDGYIRVHDATDGMPAQYFSHGGLSVTSDGQLIITYTEPSTVYVRRGLPCDENGAVVARVATLLVDNGELIEGSVSRASTAWYWGSSGLIESVGNNTPVVEYNPANNALRGLAIRKQWTNSLLDNRDLSTGNWTNNGATQDATGADGTANSAWTFSGTDDASQAITVTDNSNTHSNSWLIAQGGGTATLQAIFSGGTGLTYTATFNATTGVATEGDDAAADDITVTDAGDWWIVEIAAANNGTGNTSLTFTTDVSSGTFVQDFPAINLNSSYAGPPIVTGASAVTREADDITVTSIPWFNESQGSVFVTATVIDPNDGNNKSMFSVSDGSTDEEHIFRVLGTGNIQANLREGGIFTVMAGAGPSAITEFKGIYTYNGTDGALYSDGSQLDTSSSLGEPSGLTEAKIGDRSGSGGIYLEGWIKELIYYPRRLSNSQLQSLTS